MIKFKKLYMKNFLSIGNVEQEIDFTKSSLTLIIGENIDINSGVGSGARNGVGKSAIIQALCYAIYGIPLTQIKKDNLINKVNKKGMIVRLEFEKDGNLYIIERGRKPNFVNFYVNNKKINIGDNKENDDAELESEGDSKWTQREIQKVIGMSINLFRHLVTLNTFTIPFLSLPIAQQRQIIEELFGITRLSEKAELLKLKIKEVKDMIREEEIKIEAIKSSNERIKNSINLIEKKSRIWENSKKKDIDELKKQISILENLDIEKELEIHKLKHEFSSREKIVKNLKNNLRHIQKDINENKKRLQKLLNNREKILSEKCPLCGQTLHNKEELLESVNNDIESLEKLIKESESKEKEYLNEIESMEIPDEILNAETFYKEISEAYNHRVILEKLKEELEKKIESKNPYEEQIKSLEESGIQEVNYSRLNELNYLKEHQEALLKFLTSKDSFIRKRIIDQNLNYLNHKLKYYTESLQLPHQVKFMNDLSVEINELGVDFDFDNLSRGEKTRLILSLSWAFRDVYESMNDSINIMFIDELIDNGLDPIGVESSVIQLKKMSRENRKNIFLISHREELMNRVEDILYVVKENGFTNILNEY